MEHVEFLATAGDVEIKPPDAEAYNIMSVEVESAGVAEFFTELKIGRTTVGYFMTEADGRNHLRYDRRQVQGDNIFKYLTKLGIKTSYPIPSGESFVVRNLPASRRLKIVYEIWEEGDITAAMSNGTEATEYWQLNYGFIPVSAIVPGAYNTLTHSFLPAEMVTFPFGEPVPANMEVDIIGFFGIPSYFGRTTDRTVFTRRVRMFKGRKLLFTKQIDGFMFESNTKTGTAVAFDYGDSQIGFGDNVLVEDVLILPQALTFTSGEEMTIQILFSGDVTVTGATANDKKIRFGVIEKIRKV